jgi:aminoglycoside 6'-N-acetyltransferase
VTPLRGKRLLLRPVDEADRGRFREILSEPDVARWWWGTRGLDRAVDECFEQEKGEAVYAIEVAGAVVGMIQFYEETEPDYRHAAIDLFLDSDHQRQALGPEALRTLIRHLFDERGHHRVTIDPAAHNERAIRAYERVGFKAVGIMRAYERGQDGTWHDSVLMDLLPDDLT